MTPTTALALISIAAATILNLSPASAQSLPATTDSTDSNATHDKHTPLCFYLLAALSDNFGQSDLPPITLGVRYSSAQDRGSSGFGFTAGLSADVLGDFVALNASIGTEMINNGFVAGANSGVAIVVNDDVIYGFAELIAGYELPLADWVAIRLQGGPLIYFETSWDVTYRANLGLVVR